MFIEIAHAQGATAGSILQTFAQEIVNPIILFLFALALLLFLWGMSEYIRGADSADARQKGRYHMLWGIIGLFIMISAYSILYVVTRSVFG